ncbi:MAG: methyltransferase [Gammaproteobacteria bacterium]|nr:methyltransferase [Gammaproteobacteria bacterium]
MADTPKVDTVRLQKMARAFISSASLFAAIDLGIFTAVAEGDNTIDAFAKRAGISALNAERIMTMCAAEGLLDWRDGVYVNAPDVERYLVESERRYAGAWLRFMRPNWGRWGELTKLLSTAEAPLLTPSIEKMTVEKAREYHAATSSVGFGAGRRFSRDVDLSGRSKLMDLGGGSGAYSIVAVQQYPNLSAVVFDLPTVAVVTDEYIAEHGVADKVTAQGGDFTRDALPEGCDVAVMASNLPMYGREVIAAVIGKAYDALEAGGEMHLVGEMLDDDRVGPADAALWGLAEALSNSTGLAHTRADCVGYFEAVGFTGVQVHEFIPGILTRVCGTKPA